MLPLVSIATSVIHLSVVTVASLPAEMMEETISFSTVRLTSLAASNFESMIAVLIVLLTLMSFAAVRK